MTHARAFLRRLWALVRSARMDRDIDEEIESHLAEAAEEYVQQGLSPVDARRAARRAFGGSAQTKEMHRQVRSFMWLEDLWRDARHAARTLRRTPAFTAAAVATLALGVCATTTMFSVVNAVLLRPLPYQHPEELAMLWTEDLAQNVREGRSALPDVAQWRSQSQTFADLATFDAVSTTLTGSDGAEQIVGASISPNLLSLLGVEPVRGRSISAEEAEQQRLVLISHRFWRAHFGGAEDAVGATIVLDGLPSRIIGVLPDGFEVARLDADVWKPRASAEQESARAGDTWFVVGRLRPHVKLEQAQAEMTAIARRLNDESPAADRDRGIDVVPLREYVVGPQSRLALWLLGGAVLCVFLIAVANVAGLSLGRNAVRAPEMAVRAALGASGARIARQLVTESLLLALVSGLIGVPMAGIGIRFIRVFGPANLARLNDIRLDSSVGVWAVAISTLAGILVGTAPAIATLRRGLRTAGLEGGRSVTSGPVTRRFRRVLVVAEFALAIVLLAGAGLLVRSWSRVNSIDPGFRPDRVLVMELSTPTTFGASAERRSLYDRVLEEIRGVPGVDNAGIIGDLFVASTREQTLTIDRDGGAVSERLQSRTDEVSTDFFTAIGTPLVRGRFFSIDDRPGTLPVVIVNDTMARRVWPGLDPVGRKFKLGPPDSDRPWYTVVGVVADMRRQGLEREPFPQMFVSLAQTPPRRADLLIRTSSRDPVAMTGALRAAVRRVEKSAPIFGVARLEDELGTYLTERRFQTTLLTGFALVALLMAAVGIYGLIQYSIATRTREIGVRMAIGAQAVDIFRMMIGEGLTLSVIGLGLVLVGALWPGSMVSSLLVGVTARDPLTLAGVSLLLMAVAAAACYFPARRAMKIDPIVALRMP